MKVKDQWFVQYEDSLFENMIEFGSYEEAKRYYDSKTRQYRSRRKRGIEAAYQVLLMKGIENEVRGLDD